MHVCDNLRSVSNSNCNWKSFLATCCWITLTSCSLSLSLSFSSVLCFHDRYFGTLDPNHSWATFERTSNIFTHRFRPWFLLFDALQFEQSKIGWSASLLKCDQQFVHVLMLLINWKSSWRHNGQTKQHLFHYFDIFLHCFSTGNWSCMHGDFL